MHFDVTQWVQGGTHADFHLWIPWLAFCAGALVVWFYYLVEGRKRIFGSHALNKALFDKITNQFAAIAFVGWFLIFFLWADAGLLEWRLWRLIWLAWLVIVAGRWAIYFMFKYKTELEQYRAYRTHQKYVPQPKAKRAAKAGAR